MSRPPLAEGMRVKPCYDAIQIVSTGLARMGRVASPAGIITFFAARTDLLSWTVQKINDDGSLTVRRDGLVLENIKSWIRA